MIISNQHVIQTAHKLGFDLAGFAKAEEVINEAKKLEEWLQKGHNAGMYYMQHNLDKRKNIRLIMEDAKSVISLGMNYYIDEQHSSNNGYGKVSRYAWGKDYHLIIWEKLDEFIEELKSIDPCFSAKTYVDTGPVMDKVWAAKAGLGWFGKHSNIITKEFGSWIFLATIITNYEFDYNTVIPDFCGSCRRCIDACPTGAIIDEYTVDANKCISYLTIENKNEIPDEFIGKFNNWLFGCDVCQDVCPWNKKFALQTNEYEFNPKHKNKELLLSEIENMNQDEFKERFLNSPIKRTKLDGLKRNARHLMKEK